MRFAPPAARCRVYTFKEGLLSAVAHDLLVEVTRFHVEVDEAAATVAAEFDAASLRVVTAMAGGAPTGALSADDKQKIERTIADEVLDARRHPVIRYGGRAAGGAIDGTLELHGARRPLRVPYVTRGDVRVATARVHQPEFGIRPYRAMLGTLRVAADVEVVVEIPTAGRGP